jgi:protein-tyrosine phosphatase
MIDWHCHILPELDDGASSLEVAVAMARLLADAGYTHVCCTPHRLRGMYDTSPGAMRSAVERLHVALREEGVPLVLVPGMEYCLDEFFVEDFSSDPVSLGTSNRVLVETPSKADPQLLRENIFHLVRNGYTPLFAHPERHAFLAPPPRHSVSMFGRVKAWIADPGQDESETLDNTLLVELKNMGCEFQGNLGSVGGYYGSLVKAQETRLREAEIFSCFGSDGHDPQSLEKYLIPAIDEIAKSHEFLLTGPTDAIAS